MYRIDEGLSVICTEIKDHLDLILAGEDCLHERNNLMREQSVID